MLWDRCDYLLFTWEQTEDREVKQLNQSDAVLSGVDKVEFPGIHVQGPFTYALFCIAAHSIVWVTWW